MFEKFDISKFKCRILIMVLVAEGLSSWIVAPTSYAVSCCNWKWGKRAGKRPATPSPSVIHVAPMPPTMEPTESVWLPLEGHSGVSIHKNSTRIEVSPESKEISELQVRAGQDFQGIGIVHDLPNGDKEYNLVEIAAFDVDQFNGSTSRIYRFSKSAPGIVSEGVSDIPGLIKRGD